MAATYINGNAFKVNFILWKKDIVSYFWYSYFFHPIEYLKKTETKRFFHAVVYAILMTVCLFVVANLLDIHNYLFFAVYFPSIILIMVARHYIRALHSTQTLMGRHYSFILEDNQMKIIDSKTNEEIVIDGFDILSIGEKEDMLIIYTKEDEYILPTRVLTDSQIESVLAFK
jgi:FlaA1/EpsC-like NDP-sugar epimerase